jgi:23S rRNA (uracil1939-C5)-methyltransferase
MVVPAAAFTQVNQHMNQKLVSAVLDAVARHEVCTFLDAYAGAGNFTLPLLAHGLKGEATDIHAAGVYCARSVARDRGWSFDGFQVGDARKLMTAMVRAKRQFDLVLLDPPREGSRNVLQVTLQLKPKLILLVACDPVALARDLRSLVNAGGRVEKLTVFDMFPHTHHFETLAEVSV